MKILESIEIMRALHDELEERRKEDLSYEEKENCLKFQIAVSDQLILLMKKDLTVAVEGNEKI